MKRWTYLLCVAALSGCTTSGVDSRDTDGSAEIVGWIDPSDPESAQVLPSAVDGVRFKDDDAVLEGKPQTVGPGTRKILVIYYGSRGILARKRFVAFGELRFTAEAAARYQCRGQVEGDAAILWIVRLPAGEIVSAKQKVPIRQSGF